MMFRIIYFLSLFVGSLITSAQSLSDAQLKYISDIVNPYPIVGLGEAEHFYRGYYNTKIQLAKYLIDQGKVDVVALEASMHVTSQLNEYIQGAKTLDLDSVLKDLNEPYKLQGAGLYDCVEMREWILWLKDHNQAGKYKVELAGIDFQNYSSPLHALENYANPSEKSLLSETKEMLDASMRAILDSNIMIITSPAWISRFQKARTHIEKLQVELATEENETLFTELLQFTRLWDDPGFPRDSLMYENLSSVLSTNKRTLVWSANFHLENDPAFKGPKKLGVFLKRDYPDEYFMLGVADNAEQRVEIQTPSENTESRKYNMILKVPKGARCEKL